MLRSLPAISMNRAAPVLEVELDEPTGWTVRRSIPFHAHRTQTGAAVRREFGLAVQTIPLHAPPSTDGAESSHGFIRAYIIQV